MDYKKIGENIKKARKEAGLTQQQLADIIERTESSIRKYEKGSVEIPYSVLERIARALKEDVDELINPTQGINTVESDLDKLRKKVYDLRYSLNEKGLQKTADYMCDLIKIKEYKINN